ncbi:MAG TPA: glycosyltransferase family 2 protein [Gemmatimonadaceae bacterium]|nr:glycosyltransferase family 2 protein [Gemmatimonadaceae bacterium]
MQNEHAVVAVVVTFRAAELTVACVDSLRQSVDVRLHVVVVDNASGDDSLELFRSRFGDAADVTIHARDVNDGYTGGNNAGVALAREIARMIDARYVFILNNDTVLDPDCVRRLVDEAERDDHIAIATPRIFFGDPRDRLWFGGGRFSLWRGRPVHVGYREAAPDHGPWNESRDIDYASGCALLVRLSSVSDPIFDVSLFTYAEDVDLSLRVTRRRGRIRYVPRAVMWHFEGSGHRRAGGQSLRFYLNVRNLLRVDARYARWYHWLTLAPFLAIDVVGRYAAVAVRDGDWPALAAVFRGAQHAMTGGTHAIEPPRPDDAR